MSKIFRSSDSRFKNDRSSDSRFKNDRLPAPVTAPQFGILGAKLSEALQQHHDKDIAAAERTIVEHELTTASPSKLTGSSAPIAPPPEVTVDSTKKIDEKSAGLRQRLAQLQAEQEQLLREIEEAQRAERVEAIKTMHHWISVYHIRPDELGWASPPARSAAKAVKAKGPAKYKDPLSDATWTGMGKAPKWYRQALDHGYTKDSLKI
jgi:DNA-binding protein H-NS